MTKDQFDQAVINTQARFAAKIPSVSGEGDGLFQDYVHFNEAKDGKAYYSVVFKEGYSSLPSEIDIFFKDQLKKVEKKL